MSAIRYVRTTGSDSASGESESNPKLTVAGAMASSPNGAFIDIGRGTYNEIATPIQIKGGFHFRGMGTGSGGTDPTKVKLAAGRDTHLFECLNTSAQNHGLFFEHMELNGNYSQQSPGAVYSCIKLAGGYGVELHHIALSDSALGIDIGGGYMNIQMMNITGSSCRAGFLRCGNTQSGGIFSLEGAQIDKCGVIPIQIIYGTDGDGHMFRFSDVKMENQIDPLLHAKCISFLPRSSGVGNSVFITVENSFFCNNAAAANQHEAPLYELNNPGLGANWYVRNVEVTSHYQRGWRSMKTRRQTKSRRIVHMIEPANQVVMETF